MNDSIAAEKKVKPGSHAKTIDLIESIKVLYLSKIASLSLEGALRRARNDHFYIGGASILYSS
jgi:hypothetical protein